MSVEATIVSSGCGCKKKVACGGACVEDAGAVFAEIVLPVALSEDGFAVLVELLPWIADLDPYLQAMIAGHPKPRHIEAGAPSASTSLGLGYIVQDVVGGMYQHTARILGDPGDWKRAVAANVGRVTPDEAGVYSVIASPPEIAGNLKPFRVGWVIRLPDAWVPDVQARIAAGEVVIGVGTLPGYPPIEGIPALKPKAGTWFDDDPPPIVPATIEIPGVEVPGVAIPGGAAAAIMVQAQAWLAAWGARGGPIDPADYGRTAADLTGVPDARTERATRSFQAWYNWERSGHLTINGVIDVPTRDALALVFEEGLTPLGARPGLPTAPAPGPATPNAPAKSSGSNGALWLAVAGFVVTLLK